MKYGYFDEPRPITREQLRVDIGLLTQEEQSKLLDITLDLRKFEIDNYWKRSTYYWAFTVVAFVALGAILGKDGELLEIHFSMLPFVCSIGLIFALALYLSSRGSSYWHAHWEALNEEVARTQVGDIFRIMLDPESNKGLAIGTKLFNAYPSSVTKINAIVACYLVVLWLILLMYFSFCTENEIGLRWLNLAGLAWGVYSLLFKAKSSGIQYLDDGVTDELRFVLRSNRNT